MEIDPQSEAPDATMTVDPRIGRQSKDKVQSSRAGPSQPNPRKSTFAEILSSNKPPQDSTGDTNKPKTGKRKQPEDEEQQETLDLGA